jgi:hypothetical protein
MYSSFRDPGGPSVSLGGLPVPPGSPFLTRPCIRSLCGYFYQAAQLFQYVYLSGNDISATAMSSAPSQPPPAVLRFQVLRFHMLTHNQVLNRLIYHTLISWVSAQ